MKKNDYIVIQAYMVSELKLSGNRLIVYALINGFSKDGNHEFHGSVNYIREWTNITKNTVLSTLKSLVDDGLVEKREYIENNVKFCAYKTTGAKNEPVVQLPLFDDGAKNEPNNINKGGEDSKEIDEKSSIKKDDNSSQKIDLVQAFDDFRKKYKSLGGTARGLETELNDLKKKHKDWKVVIPMLGYALEKEAKEREDARRRGKFFPQMKNLQTYINNRCWESYSDGYEDYDPNAYHPEGFNYDEEFNAFRFCDYIPNYDLKDGYNDSTRPDGARIVEQCNVWVWSAKEKRWNRSR